MSELTTQPNALIPDTQSPIQPLGDLVHNAVIAAGRSPHTRRAYQTSIGQFFQYLSQAQNITPPLAEPETNGRKTIWAFRGDSRILLHITPSLLDGFRTWLENTGASPNTQETRLAAVITFLSVCYRDGLIPDDQARRLSLQPYKPRRQRHQKPTGRRLSPPEVKKLRAAMDTNTLKGKRDLAILDMMLFAGLRRAELCALTGDSLQQHGSRYWLIIHGKGHKTRRLKVHDMLYQSLTVWLASAEKSEQTKDTLFEGMTRHGRLTTNPLTGATIARLVAQYAHAAGLAPATGTNALAPHDLRRTCARNAYDNGAPLPKIQQFLGHANIETTMRYIGYDEDDTETATDYVRY